MLPLPLMKPILFLTVTGVVLSLTSCIETTSSGSSATPTGLSNSAAPRQKLNKHDIALRFLTAFIRLDKNMALQYASPLAVSKLDWNRQHSGNIPYYDDKMILYFNGGWARVYFQEVNGSYIVSDLEVHHR